MKKKILIDIILNMLASFIPIFVYQFFVLPIVAQESGADLYGQVLSIIALMNLSVSSFGSTLTNLRLIRFKIYEESNENGDFSILLLLSVIGNIIFMLIGLIIYGRSFNIVTLFMVIITSVLYLMKLYLSVEFRIKLNFKYVLLNSIFLVIGYVIGLILFLITNNWILIYLCGFGGSLAFVMKKTVFLKEPLMMSSFFKQTAFQAIILFSSGVLTYLGVYVDKLILYPLLGGVAVSVYYASTIIGKTISLVIGPITSVLLSYLAHMKTFSDHNFKLVLLVSSILGAVGYIIVILISKPILTLIYPQFVEEAIKYIPVVTLGTIIIIISNVLNSVILKFCNTKWQVYINGSYMFVYFVLAICLIKISDLMGFCIGILIASIFRLIMIIVAYISNRKKFNM